MQWLDEIGESCTFRAEPQVLGRSVKHLGPSDLVILDGCFVAVEVADEPVTSVTVHPSQLVEKGPAERDLAEEQVRPVVCALAVMVTTISSRKDPSLLSPGERASSGDGVDP
jgi:hypothetical protein